MGIAKLIARDSVIMGNFPILKCPDCKTVFQAPRFEQPNKDHRSTICYTEEQTFNDHQKVHCPYCGERITGIKKSKKYKKLEKKVDSFAKVLDEVEFFEDLEKLSLRSDEDEDDEMAS